jgi:chitinase
MFAIDDFESSLATAQENVRTWARGGCVDISATRGSEDNIQWTVLTAELSSPQTNQTKRGVEADSSKIDKRADCRAIQVVSGDGCASLSTRCGIRGADFTKYNPKQNLCSTLAEKQWVCCSAGTLPDMRPKPQADGTCAAYTVVENDGCFAIADSFGLKTEDIETFNEKTWGWAGCSRFVQVSSWADSIS